MIIVLDEQEVPGLRSTETTYRYYPANALAECIAKLLGHDDLKEQNIHILREGGFEVRINKLALVEIIR